MRLTGTTTYLAFNFGTANDNIPININLGNFVITEEISQGQQLGTLPSLTLAETTFNGYYTARTGGTAVSAATTVGTNPGTYYAQITQNNNYQNTTTNEYYATMQEAFRSASSGQTVRVINGITESYRDASLKTGKILTLETTAGKTTTFNGCNIYNFGTLTISGAGNLTTASARSFIANTGTMNITNTGEISNTNTGNYRTINNTGTINKTGAGTISSTTSDSTIAGGTINVSNGTVSTSNGKAINTATGSVSITGGTISSTSSCAVGMYGSGTLTVSESSGNTTRIEKSGTVSGATVQTGGSATANILGGTIETVTGGSGAINHASSGALTINGAKVKQSGTGNTVVVAGSGPIEIKSGSEITSASANAIRKESSGTITISGGTIKSTNGEAIANVSASGKIKMSSGTVTSDTRAAFSVQNGEVEITGGEIVGKTYGIWEIGNSNVVVTIGTQGSGVNITTPKIIATTGKGVQVESGGVLKFYDGIIYASTIANTIVGNILAENIEPNYSIVNGSANYNGIEYKFATLAIPTKNYLLHDGGTEINTYDTLSQAINAIPANANKSYRIVALNNTTEPATTQSKGTASKPVTLDLNGKTITMTGTLTNSGYLTIDGTGTLTTSAAISLIKNDGTLNIPSTGTISNTNTGAYSLISNGNGTINKTGSGTLSSSTSNNTIQGGTVNISAGTVSSSGRDAINNAWNCNISGTAHILCSTPGNVGSAIYMSSGSLKVSEDAVIEKTGTGQAAVVGVAGSATATISGGTIKSVAGSAAYVLHAQGSGKVTVQGGMVSSLGTGYAIYKSGTGDVEVKSGSVTGSGSDTIYNNNSTGIITISGGEVKNTGENAAVYNNVAGTIILGDDEDGNVSTTSPIITATASSGIGVNVGTGTLKFYDGVIKGSTNNSIVGTVSDTPTGYAVKKSTADNIETATLDNHYNVRYLSGNLLYGLDDCGETAGIESSSVPNKSHMNYSISNGVVTVTAKSDDGYGMTTGRLYLEANKTYRFSCSTNGTWGVNGADTVEACLMKDGLNSKYYRMESTDGYEFTPDTSGTYWLRLDVNQNGKTYTFSNISIYEIADTQSKTYGSTYAPMPTVSRTGYTSQGWAMENLFDRNATPAAASTYIKNDGTTASSGEYSLYQVNIEPNTAYTIINSGSSTAPGYAIYNSSGEKLSAYNYANRAAVTFTTPANAAYIKFSVVTLSTSGRYDKDTFYLGCIMDTK